ncbi:RmlD substrate binding domain protein [compost metagenome]
MNDQWRTPTLAEDLADGCILIARQRAEGIFNISGKDLLNPHQMAVMTADYFGLDKTLINETDGSQFRQTAKRPARTGFILDKPVSVLGYNPRSFQEGIAFLAAQIKEK